MKNMIKKKFCFLLLISLTANSCAVSQSLWIARAGGDRIDSFFIDHEKNRVVLIGDQHPVTKAGEHYSLSDPSGKLAKVFELGIKSGKPVFNLEGMETRGSDVFGWMWIGFKMNNLSSDEIILLNSFNAHPKKDENLFGYGLQITNSNPNYLIIKTTRYPSSQEPIKNFCSETNNDPSCTKITKFSKPWQGVIWNRYTNSEKALRIAATPFTVAADILLTPLYLVGFIGMGISDGAGNVDPRTPQPTNSK